MTQNGHAILAPLIYYDLLERPLTALEIFKYLWAEATEMSFFNVWQELKKSGELKPFVRQKNGLYFMNSKETAIKTRLKRTKLAQLKWKKLKKTAKYLGLVPWLRLAAATGSLTSYNTEEQSDFDLLIIVRKKRLWLGRILLTGLVGLLRKRRHGQFTQNRICLNCYLTEGNMEITKQAKPRDFHSAQEYGRLTPILEAEKGVYANFTNANPWLADFLKNYPWPNAQNAKRIQPPAVFIRLRQIIEWLLDGQIGKVLETIVAKWQNERINKKRQNEQPGPDQIFINNDCLMFHPQSKGDKLMKEFNLKMAQFEKD